MSSLSKDTRVQKMQIMDWLFKVAYMGGLFTMMIDEKREIHKKVTKGGYY